jgi:hypothetical protein
MSGYALAIPVSFAMMVLSPLPPLMKKQTQPYRTWCATVATLLTAFTIQASQAQEPAGLKIDPIPAGFTFKITGDEDPPYWLLQHSDNLADWSNLVFLNKPGPGGVAAGIDMPLVALDNPTAPRCFFRAIPLAQDNPNLRNLLGNRHTWRVANLQNYQFVLYSPGSFESRRTRITVQNGVVTNSETLYLNPPMISPLNPVPTVNDLFAELVRLLATNPASFNVTYNATLGYPQSVYIDRSLMISDEEISWTIESLTPLP